MVVDPDPRVIAICGSLRAGSRTKIALEDALRAATEAGATTELVDLSDYELPGFSTERPPLPAAEALRDAVGEADSVLLGTPNYHGSYSGVLKNALDYCGRDEFEGTTVGLLEVAGGAFSGAAVGHLRAICRTLRAWTLPLEVRIPNAADVFASERITDDDILERTHRLGRSLAMYAGMATYPTQIDRSAAVFDGQLSQ